MFTYVWAYHCSHVTQSLWFAKKNLRQNWVTGTCEWFRHFMKIKHTKSWRERKTYPMNGGKLILLFSIGAWSRFQSLKLKVTFPFKLTWNIAETQLVSRRDQLDAMKTLVFLSWSTHCKGFQCYIFTGLPFSYRT